MLKLTGFRQQVINFLLAYIRVDLRQRLHLLQSIGPVRHTADQSDQDAFGPGKRLFGVGVDRQRVF